MITPALSGPWALLAALAVAGPVAQAPRLQVPFVAQGPLLCGGAAAAMVERYWGTRGVYGEDYADLVRLDEGGIRASELTEALAARGYEVRVSRDEPELAFAALEDGVPAILLLESRFARLHYVVLVGLDGDRAWIHDPGFGPERPVERDELLDRWGASGHWTLLAVPQRSDRAGVPRGAMAGAGQPELAAAPAPAAVAAQVPALGDAMTRLRAGDLAGAREALRPLLQDAGSDASPEMDAMVAARGAAAAAPAAAAVAEGVTATAWRIQATAWYLEDEPRRALDSWNAIDEPVIDLVRVDGLGATRYQTASDRLPVGHGDVLTSDALALASRRLAQLPSVQAEHVEYRPLPDGTVELWASVLERPRWPGRGLLVAEGVRALVHGFASVGFGPFLASGDRLRLAGSWRSVQRFAGASLAAPVPPLPGIATLGFEWRAERYALPAGVDGGGVPASERRVRTHLALEEWVRPSVRVGIRGALESWRFDGTADPPSGPRSPDARLASLGLGGLWSSEDDRTRVTVDVDGWTGSGLSFGRVSLEGGAVVPHGSGREWRLVGGATAIGADAPRTLWPGAGTGRIRAPLLRAHDLSDGDAIRGPALGRQLLYGTVEHRFFRAFGPLRWGAMLFVDAAHAASRGEGLDDRSLADVGTGVFLDLGTYPLDISLAYGADGWKLSARAGG